MTTTPQFVTETGYDSLADSAREHLWMHFTRHSTYYSGGHVPVIVKGEGPYIWDDQGNKYFDGLAGLFVVQDANSTHIKIGDLQIHHQYTYTRTT